MKFKCRQSLYWHWVPGYDGHLSEKAEPFCYPQRIGFEKSSLVFEEGEEYEIEVRVTKTSLEYVSIFGIGRDGEGYLLFQDEAHYHSTNLIRTHFACD